MSNTRVALLIGCSRYEDPAFPELPAPYQDVSALTRVLADPSIGDFTVNTLFNRPSAEVCEQIEGFFADRKPDDLVLLYFSCHGVLDPKGRLFFVVTNTKKERLDSTGISAPWVAEQMDQSRSQCIVLLLDCCYSGAFSRGLRRRSAGVEEISGQLSGRGRVVITASDKLEYAYGSEFTNAVVQGLETGAADLDGDGHVSVDELYQYVYNRVRQKNLREADTNPDVQAAVVEALHSVPPRPPVADHRPQRKRRLVIGGLVLTTAIVAGTAITVSGMTAHPAVPCSPSTRPADGVLSLGTLLPNNTGGFVYTGPALNAGVQLAMKDINDAGGIPNIADVKLDPINQKDEGDPSKDTASRSTDELLNNQVDAIIGPARSAVGLKVIDKVTCAGVILFSPSNTSQAFTTYPDHGLYFRAAPPVGVEATVLSKLVVADGNSTVVVMSRDDAYGNDIREATVAAIRESGRQVLDSFHYDPNTRDYTKDIQRVKDKNPENAQVSPRACCS